MTNATQRHPLRYLLLGLVMSSSPSLAVQQPEAVANQPSAEAQPICQPEPAVERQLGDAEAAVLRIFVGPGDERSKIHAAVDDAYAVIVFPNIAKVGFFVTAAQGKGLLSYREANGLWSYPILVSARVTSVGPHFSMQTIDMMIVARTQEALVRLFASGSSAPAVPKPTVMAEIVTYSSNRGLTAGLSLDDYNITIDHDANQKLYCQPILTEDLTREGLKATFKPPPCAQKFAQTINRVSGKAPITRGY
jgi:lipid-binding SYLF domain-containing protein